MSKHKRFRLKTLGDLQAELAVLDLPLPVDRDVSILADRMPLAALETPNRFIVHPMEGFDSTADGGPGELSTRRYTRYAHGGSGLIWFEATAVLHGARSNPKQLCLVEGNVDVYRRLVDATRAAARESHRRDVVLILQLTHSGRYSKPSGVPRPIIAHHSEVLDPKHDLPEDYPLVSDDDLDRLQDTYVEAARLAARAGFDGVDVKACHRYLVSELLASHTREGKYGGSLENRSRFLRETLGKIRDAVPEVFITTRINVFDAIAYPFGFGVDRKDYRIPDLSEPIEVIRQLQAIGIPLVNCSIGNPYFNPHYGRPFDRPIAGLKPPEENPLVGVARFVEITRQIQQAIPDLPVVGGGYSWLRHLMPYVASGVVRTGGATLIGQGRGAFAYPDSVNDVLATGQMSPAKSCIACSACTQIMRDGTMTGCVVRDTKIYGPQYKLGRRFALDRLREEARRCRDCEFATCTANCPARVDVPAFVRAFADGDIPRAYDVLRTCNVLPEMCAHVCPAEVQCEGGCIERIFSEHSISIRDIQLVVSQIARLQGHVGVRLPEETSGRNVAIVGGGPAGLACAVRLLELGHAVTIHEKGDRLGGTPECIIPGARYDGAGDEIEAVLGPAKAAGRIAVRHGCALGDDVSLADLRQQHDAVFLAMGLGRSKSLGQADGVVDALGFLADVKRGKITTVGEKVAVLGGGNTATDAAVTAKELGAADVYLVYRRSLAEMPAWPAERDRLIDAGGHLLILTQPLGYETDDQGKLTALRIARTELGPVDESGRRRPVVVADSESLMHVDLVIEAIGQGLDPDLRAALSDLTLTKHGLIATSLGSMGPNSTATSQPGVFAGGDLTNGGTTAVRGISEGMLAAEEIDRFLRS